MLLLALCVGLCGSLYIHVEDVPLLDHRQCVVPVVPLQRLVNELLDLLEDGRVRSEEIPAILREVDVVALTCNLTR